MSVVSIVRVFAFVEIRFVLFSVLKNLYSKKDLQQCMSTCSCLLCVSLTLLLLFIFLFFFLCNSSPNESLEHVNRPVSEFLQRTLLSFFFFAAEIPTFFIERFLHRCWIIYTLRHLQSSDSLD